MSTNLIVFILCGVLLLAFIPWGRHRHYTNDYRLLRSQGGGSWLYGICDRCGEVFPKKAD